MAQRRCQSWPPILTTVADASVSSAGGTISNSPSDKSTENMFGKIARKLAAALAHLQAKHEGQSLLITPDDLQQLQAMESFVRNEDMLVSSLADFIFSKVQNAQQARGGIPLGCSESGGTGLQATGNISFFGQGTAKASHLAEYVREEEGTRKTCLTGPLGSNQFGTPVQRASFSRRRPGRS